MDHHHVVVVCFSLPLFYHPHNKNQTPWIQTDTHSHIRIQNNTGIWMGKKDVKKSMRAFNGLCAILYCVFVFAYSPLHDFGFYYIYETLKTKYIFVSSALSLSHFNSLKLFRDLLRFQCSWFMIFFPFSQQSIFLCVHLNLRFTCWTLFFHLVIYVADDSFKLIKKTRNNNNNSGGISDGSGCCISQNMMGLFSWYSTQKYQNVYVYVCVCALSFNRLKN